MNVIITLLQFNFNFMYLQDMFANMTQNQAIVLMFFILWSLAWKGFALWISATEKNKWWFIAVLLFNSAGILPIIYLLGFSKWGRNYFVSLKKKKTNEQ